MTPIDLRSDTVTRPTPAMREAMARADVGDDVYGEDPTVNLLQEEVAGLLGKEAALFVPSGTMANQVSLGVLTRPGDEIVCDAGAHCISFESGALAALWGVQARTIAAERGLLEPAAVEAAIRPAGDVYPRTRVVALENTHNRGGGAIYPLERVRALGELARAGGLSLHLDGARLWNACAATGVAPADYAREATTVSVCLSKGLGAPAGSLVAGARELVAEARRLRKRLGGGMRQAGILAAAGLHALRHHRARLPEDHANARHLADGLTELGGLLPLPVETNLVFVAFTGRSAAELSARLAREGVLANPEGSRPDLLRLVTHMDVSRADVDEALVRIGRVLRGA
ncbi:MULTISPECIES: low specificity L-threonine aldolase [unclassified Anaeromyxobacter]|uniref:threonine aldolase family protein n=1 Tax=unclassified Anaeromyxobacter TaxID=2620896 RepID=UPI001F58E4B6|nr:MULTISPECIES: GntG family PLP-dependent aldolase [unclassified Anaeromyxobacter]